MEHRTNETPLLQTIGLQKYFKVRGNSLLHAVDGIDLTLYSGQTLGVVGESGCGKSTLGRTILKLIEPTGGQILYNGKDITKLSTRKMHPYRKEMQIIFQDPYSSIDPRKSVIEVIAEYMLIHKVYKTQAEAFNRAAELMDLVGLARRYTNSYPHELDGGLRQRVARHRHGLPDDQAGVAGARGLRRRTGGEPLLGGQLRRAGGILGPRIGSRGGIAPLRQRPRRAGAERRRGDGDPRKP